VTLCRAALRSRPQPLPPADARVSAQRHEFDKAARATLTAAAAKLGAAAREPPLPRDKAGGDDACLRAAEEGVAAWLQHHEPIAWALCRKPVRRAAAAALSRVALLACADGTAAAQMPPAPQAGSGGSLLRRAPPCGRFGYLPVQTPPLRAPRFEAAARHTAGSGAGAVNALGLDEAAVAAAGADLPVAGTDSALGGGRSGLDQIRGALGERLNAASLASGLGGAQAAAQLGSLLSGVGGAARAAQMALGVKTPSANAQ